MTGHEWDIGDAEAKEAAKRAEEEARRQQEENGS